MIGIIGTDIGTSGCRYGVAGVMTGINGAHDIGVIGDIGVNDRGHDIGSVRGADEFPFTKSKE